MQFHVDQHAARTPVAWLVALALAGLAVGSLAGPLGPSPTPTTPGPSMGPSTGPSTIASPSAGSTLEPTATPAAPTSPPATPSSTPPPSPLPTPRPTPSVPAPTPTVAPSPTPGSASLLVTHGSRTGNQVALTFDMGGRVGDALAIMNWLVGHDVHATIYMTGAMADNPNTDAGRQVLAIVESNPELFTLGNHSYTHRDFRNLSAAEISDELLRTEAAVAPYCSQDLHPFFRPPNGGYSSAVLAAVGAAGYPYTVTWDVDTIDWRPIVNDPPGPTADQIVAKVLGNARAGSIVLMHLGGYETYEALPAIVEGLRARGFQLANLEELL
jgi:peptidoglycan/xylan/chitin deacetylase (PgdA/CDA1 family)